MEILCYRAFIFIFIFTFILHTNLENCPLVEVGAEQGSLHPGQEWAQPKYDADDGGDGGEDLPVEGLVAEAVDQERGEVDTAELENPYCRAVRSPSPVQTLPCTWVNLLSLLIEESNEAIGTNVTLKYYLNCDNDQELFLIY